MATSQKAPTVKDVAQKAGVFVATVSRVMNNKGYLSEDCLVAHMATKKYHP